MAAAEGGLERKGGEQEAEAGGGAKAVLLSCRGEEEGIGGCVGGLCVRPDMRFCRFFNERTVGFGTRASPTGRCDERRRC